jgi:hypothetical protein
MEVIPGDRAYFAEEDLQRIRKAQEKQDAPKYVQAASLSPVRPQEQSARESAPRTARKENRVRGRLGVDYSGMQIPGAGITSSQFGFMIRLDAERLGGSYWKISGYYRGRLRSRKDTVQNETLRDLINRTYTLSVSYENPESRWVAGAGRLYVPWASSLSTLDGFYLGRRIGKQTVGVFGGTTPNPTSWNYDRDRQLGGAFVSTERGSFESFRFTGTAGIALSRVDWKPDRQFGFFENNLYYKRYLSIYSDVEADLRTGSQNSGNRDMVLSRSYFTVRLQPHKIISFDVNESYYRNIPTFDTRLIGTGLLDKFLFQGLSGGFRLTLPYRVGIFANTGRSSRTGDQKASWNYLFGGSLRDILGSGFRAEYRYSRFDSSFGRGTYQSVGVDRELGEGFRLDVQAGQQDVTSSFTSQRRARFLSGNIDCYVGTNYILGGGVTVYRGQVQTYNQYFLRLGYRFNNRR